jgi:hypothetical protein
VSNTGSATIRSQSASNPIITNGNTYNVRVQSGANSDDWEEI